MLVQSWTVAIQQSFQEVWNNFVVFLPNIILAVIIFAIGWVLGAILGRIVAQVVDALRVDRALESAGLNTLLERGGLEFSASGLLGGLVKWFVVVVSLLAVVDVLGLNQVGIFLENVVLYYLPQVVVAVLILLIAAVLADFVQKLVANSARAGGLSSAGLLGGIAKWAIWVFAFLVALSHLGVAAVFMQTLFAGVVVALALGLGLAFGLGGQEEAARYLKKMREEVARRD